MSVVPDQDHQPARPQQSWPRVLITLVLGVVLGASLGPALFLAIDRLELSGDLLLSFAVGGFLTLAVCLAVVGAVALLVVPRIFSSARGTLSAMVEALTKASRAHAEGRLDEAIDHAGRAIGEGVSWYSIGATRRFIAQAALGLLISFGSVVGAVLLFSQNTLLRDQNVMVKSQVGLLTEQNDKIERQLELLLIQNDKIDQQTMVADSQKRGAFATEMFSILQEVAKADRSDGKISSELTTRVAVLTSSAAPYVYLDFQSDNKGKPERIRRPLSPERGQIMVALARMKVNLSLLAKAGAHFERADLRGADLTDVDLTRVNLTSCDFSGATVQNGKFTGAVLAEAVLDRVDASNADFSKAVFLGSSTVGAKFTFADFSEAALFSVSFKDADLGHAKFVGASFNRLGFEGAKISLGSDLPTGLPWPRSLKEGLPPASALLGRAIPDIEFIHGHALPPLDGKGSTEIILCTRPDMEPARCLDEPN